MVRQDTAENGPKTDLHEPAVCNISCEEEATRFAFERLRAKTKGHVTHTF